MGMDKLKCEHTRQWFNLAAAKGKKFNINGVKYKSLTVRPFNGETTRKHPRDVSWSHGFTHYEIKESGTVGFCGTRFFEENANAVRMPRAPKV